MEVLLNGSAGPVTLLPQQQLEVRYTNLGLGAGATAQPTLAASPLSGAQVDPLPWLPTVYQRRTWMDWWWLWLPLLLLLLALLAWLLYRCWQRRYQVWARCHYVGFPPDCPEGEVDLRGLVDLGKEIGIDDLRGLTLERKGARSARLRGVPPNIELRQSGTSLSADDPVDFDDKVQVKRKSDSQRMEFTLRKPGGKESKRNL